jgi:hypothetical protein
MYFMLRVPVLHSFNSSYFFASFSYSLSKCSSNMLRASNAISIDLIKRYYDFIKFELQFLIEEVDGEEKKTKIFYLPQHF